MFAVQADCFLDENLLGQKIFFLATSDVAMLRLLEDRNILECSLGDFFGAIE